MGKGIRMMRSGKNAKKLQNINIIITHLMAAIPTSFNPSDYQFLLKSVIEGNTVSKAQSLKRFNTLVSTDKKQFSIYAKRIVLGIQELLTEPKEDINLLASTLAYEIINLNPREIQYYIRTKLLKNMVRNLGDPKPQIRKTSHYCLLAYVKTYKTFDELIQIYIHYGFNSDSSQLRQKSINSFQSILIMEIKYLNWSSIQFRKVVEQLLNRTKDESQSVQKASQQCLLSICKNDQIRNFSKKLPNSMFLGLKAFCQYMFSQGLLAQIKLYVAQIPQGITKNYSMMNMHNESKTLDKPPQRQQKTEHSTPQSLLTKQSLIHRIQEIRKKNQTPTKQNYDQQLKKKNDQTLQNPPKSSRLKKAESVSIVAKKLVKQSDINLPIIKKSLNLTTDKKLQKEVNVAGKPQVALGRKLIDDLKNEKDWKIRLEAIEELQNKFIMSKESNESEGLAKTFLPILIKLLADSNFKIALISLKIIEEILDLSTVNYLSLVPQLVDKISDGKVALRQNISKLIRKQFLRTSDKAWINELLSQLKKSPPPNSNIKEQILNILSKITIEASESSDSAHKQRIQTINNTMQNIIESICPLMDDLKTKIKIKTLDLLILLSVKTQRIETIKAIVAARLNQVYFQMYMEKLTKQLKNLGLYKDPDRGSTSNPKKDRGDRMMIMTNRRHNKNTTSSSLKKYASVEDHNTTARTASFVQKNNDNPKIQKQFDQLSIKNLRKGEESPQKNSIIKTYRKKTFDYKSTQYSAFSTEQVLQPFSDPQKELKLIIVEIKSDEWQVCSQALTKLRRIIENHSQLLTQPIIKLLSPEIMRLVESLRSSLSKNAVITLHDFSNKMKKMLDTELDSIFSKLLKKSLDANSFISQEVRRALVCVCSNCNQNRVVTLLLNSHTSKAIPVKLTIANVLESIAFLPKVYQKQLQRIVGILVSFLGEGSLQIRQKAKNLLSNIIGSQRGPQILRMIPNQHLNKLKIKQIKPIQSSAFRNTESDKATQNDLGLKKKKKEKIVNFPQEFQTLQTYLQQCESSDWKMREKNMKIIYQTIIATYPKQLTQHRLSGKVMDVLSKQIGDPNTKVAANALKILIAMLGSNNQLLENNLSVLTNEIFNCFGSHKNQIKKLSEELFSLITQNIEKWMLVQHMCNGALYGLQKSRPMILSKLSQILPSVYQKQTKKSLINKNVYPLINKIAEQNKPQNLEGLSILMDVCHENTNGDFLTYLKPKAIQIFNSLNID